MIELRFGIVLRSAFTLRESNYSYVRIAVGINLGWKGF